MRLFTRQTVAECLLGVTIVLGPFDLAVKHVEMNLPSVQEGQTLQGAIVMPIRTREIQRKRFRSTVETEEGKSFLGARGYSRFLFPLFLSTFNNYFSNVLVVFLL